MHCNQISAVTGLDHLLHLTHLDVSSNEITRMAGIEQLRSLKTLNFSCNLLQYVEGLQNLRYVCTRQQVMIWDTLLICRLQVS